MDDPKQTAQESSGEAQEMAQEDIDKLLSEAAAQPAGEPQQEKAETPPQPGPADETTTGRSFELPEFGSAQASGVDAKRISMLNDVKLNVKIELGRTRMLVEDVLKLGDGSVVELDKPAGDPVEVYVNERLVARGEVLVLNDNFCVRISEVLARDPHRVSA